MTKKILTSLLIAAFFAGVAFGQENALENTPESNAIAYNTFTLDVAPVILGLGAPEVVKSIGGDQVTGFYCFGIGIQYERNIDDRISLAWRLDYLGFGTGINFSFDSVNISNINVYKITFENQFRFYPFNGTFFMGGLIGYTYLNIGLDGNASVTDPIGNVYSGDISLIVERHSIKFGTRAGWRIRFGKNKGFTFEPSIGYDIGAAFGESLTNQFQKGIFGVSNFPMTGLEDLEENFQLLETFIFAGGPRMTLSLGWSF
ncbi:MAG: hypothetical protein FWC01_01550 [Treponema sp.]|nr:hypothetical protein [Treponema sp.]MCL2236890.1 hypothetical protein [Treponema sp.]